MFYALKAGLTLAEAGVRAMLWASTVWSLPFSVKDLMRHWDW